MICRFNPFIEKLRQSDRFVLENVVALTGNLVGSGRVVGLVEVPHHTLVGEIIERNFHATLTIQRNARRLVANFESRHDVSHAIDELLAHVD